MSDWQRMTPAQKSRYLAKCYRWRAKNKLKMRDYQRVYMRKRRQSAEVRELDRIASRAYHHSHKEERSQRAKLYYLRHQAHFTAYNKMRSEKYGWHKTTSQNTILMDLQRTRNRYALEKNAVGSHTFQEWLQIKAMHGYLCAICGDREPNIKLTRDHIVPLWRGGSNFITNIQPLCLPCNARKGISIEGEMWITYKNIVNMGLLAAIDSSCG